MSDAPARFYDLVASSAESTVVAEYTAEYSTATDYQSEAELEREFIEILRGQAYEYLTVNSEADLIANLRVQLEALNDIAFSDAEWERFFHERIAGANDGIVEKTIRVQEDHVQLLTRDDGTTRNIALIDKTHIHNNRLQVLNQYEVPRGGGGAFARAGVAGTERSLHFGRDNGMGGQDDAPRHPELVEGSLSALPSTRSSGERAVGDERSLHFGRDDEYRHPEPAEGSLWTVPTTRSFGERAVGDERSLHFGRDDGGSDAALAGCVPTGKNSVSNERSFAAAQDDGGRANRYDVTVLVNGLPMVHIELKRRGVNLREAFDQIDRYQRESFWAGSGLFEYVQLFVISNGTLTKYYSNTTRRQHLTETGGKKRTRKTSNSYEFTSWWADAANKPIQDLTAFAKTFFARHTLLNILTKYCVLTADRMLLVMRPYQIAATERILQRIEISTNYKLLGTIRAGGYIWHTTGSGKTLTSFKTAQLASKLPDVDKVLFVVDRQDLDYQTMREYDRFEKGAANSNTSTRILKKQLEDPKARIIITTIQKLAALIKSNKGHAIYNGHVVIIFDECHRSQFGEMHTAIVKAFKRYHLFGFTGTPIFAVNAGSGGNPLLRTTEQAFGDKLHTYTIVDAITDKNVLPFRIDYVNTIKLPEGLTDKQVRGIDTERALLDPERIRQVVGYTLEHFDQKTKRNEHYSLGDKRLRGFNALFATASIDAAKRYYAEFRKQQQALTPDQRLKIALIYSFSVNEPLDDGFLDEEGFETAALDQSSRDFLDDAIADYNATFATSFDTSADKFQNYYKDLSLRLKQREIDMAIVVNMFLTGFDATTLNTLFVDKRLVNHGLLQAFSRTNRILNSVKTYGNIVTFRDLEQETNDAIALFGNKDARGVVLLKPYSHYFEDYQAKVTELLARFPLGAQIVGESEQKAFVELFGAILRLQNILTAFDDFAGNDLLTERQGQDYRGVYLDLYAAFRGNRDADKETINDDLVFEIELIKQVEIDVDYILLLVQKYRETRGDGDDKELRAEISRSVDASPTLRNKKDLIEAFVDSVSTSGEIDAEWRKFVAERRRAELDRIIETERLRPEATRAFIDTAFRDGAVQTTGTAITRILPPMSRFSPDGGHSEKKHRVLEKLTAFFDRFFGLGGGTDSDA